VVVMLSGGEDGGCRSDSYAGPTLSSDQKATHPPRREGPIGLEQQDKSGEGLVSQAVEVWFVMAVRPSGGVNDDVGGSSEDQCRGLSFGGDG
jgi:hypothetical protein